MVSFQSGLSIIYPSSETSHKCCHCFQVAFPPFEVSRETINVLLLRNPFVVHLYTCTDPWSKTSQYKCVLPYKSPKLSLPHSEKTSYIISQQKLPAQVFCAPFMYSRHIKAQTDWGQQLVLHIVLLHVFLSSTLITFVTSRGNPVKYNNVSLFAFYFVMCTKRSVGTMSAS